MNQKKTKLFATLSFVTAIVTGIIGLVLLVVGVLAALSLIKYYSGQGVDFKQLISGLYSQGMLGTYLIEPILKPIALYGSLTVILLVVSDWLKSKVVEDAPVLNELDEVADGSYTPEYSFEEDTEESAEATEDAEVVTEEESEETK